MRIKHTTLSIASALALTACATADPSTGGPASPSTPPVTESVPDADAAAPVTTAVPAAQARRGESAFLASCTACHASSEFSANAFRRRWSSRTAADLFGLMSQTMPEDAPASLAPERYVDIVAYVLTLNGFETSGTGDAWNVQTLDRISLGPLGSP